MLWSPFETWHDRVKCSFKNLCILVPWPSMSVCVCFSIQDEENMKDFKKACGGAMLQYDHVSWPSMSVCVSVSRMRRIWRISRRRAVEPCYSMTMYLDRLCLCVFQYPGWGEYEGFQEGVRWSHATVWPCILTVYVCVCFSIQDEENMKDFKKACGGAMLQYEADTNTLTVVVSPSLFYWWNVLLVRLP